MFYCIESGFFLLIIRSILLLSIFLLFVTIKIKITIEGGGFCVFFLLCGVLINELNEIKLFTNN
ncbi:putative membrane protein [Escherichia coli DEC1A]|nr:putative membrane protein [Escherichia coli DEC1A]